MSFVPPRPETPAPATVLMGFLLASIAAVAAVFVFQYGFGLMPCVLCVWQRAPHALAILLAGIGVGQARTIDPLRHPFRTIPWKTFTTIIALLFIAHAANVGLAAFHVGVEQHWWAGTEACAGTTPIGLTAEQLSTQLLNTTPARCDEVAWSFLGISLAGFNFLLSLALAVTAAWGFIRFNAERARSAQKKPEP